MTKFQLLYEAARQLMNKLEGELSEQESDEYWDGFEEGYSVAIANILQCMLEIDKIVKDRRIDK